MKIKINRETDTETRRLSELVGLVLVWFEFSCRTWAITQREVTAKSRFFGSTFPPLGNRSDVHERYDRVQCFLIRETHTLPEAHGWRHGHLCRAVSVVVEACPQRVQSVSPRHDELKTHNFPRCSNHLRMSGVLERSPNGGFAMIGLIGGGEWRGRNN